MPFSQGGWSLGFQESSSGVSLGSTAIVLGTKADGALFWPISYSLCKHLMLVSQWKYCPIYLAYHYVLKALS